MSTAQRSIDLESALAEAAALVASIRATLKLPRRTPRRAEGWDEDLHPRDKDGRFTDLPFVDTWHRDDPTYVPPDTSAHPVIRDRGAWGSSHGTSHAMSAHAAGLMGIPGYDGYALNDATGKAVERFMQHIANDTVGSEEPLYHGFQNLRGITWAAGDTVRLPLTATAGERGVISYGVRLDRKDQAGEPTLFEFPQGTPMVAYSKWKTTPTEDSENEAKEFGHVYAEALVAGEYEVVSVREVQFNAPQHDTRPGQDWRPRAKGRVVTLRPKAVFDPATKAWRPRG